MGGHRPVEPDSSGSGGSTPGPARSRTVPCLCGPAPRSPTVSGGGAGGPARRPAGTPLEGIPSISYRLENGACRAALRSRFADELFPVVRRFRFDSSTCDPRRSERQCQVRQGFAMPRTVTCSLRDVFLMTNGSGKKIEEEPQEERGPKGSRGTGSDKPSAGPTDRPAATTDEDSDTSINPQKPSDPNAPNLQSGGN
jgi:hypothetical protein